MGKTALLFALSATVITMWLTYSAQETTMDTDDAQVEAYSNKMARDMAIKGRKLALASWIESKGNDTAAPFTTITDGGGSISITDFSVSGSNLDMTVRAEYEGAVHDLRSKYKWNPGGAINAFQIKAASVDMDISSNATLDIPKIAVDDQSLSDLDNVLIKDLGLAGNLGELGLGINNITSVLESELSSSGNSDVSVEVIDETSREQLEQELGMFFPDQVESALGSYLATNPSVQTTINNSNQLPASFGTNIDGGVLRVQDDLTISSDFSGKGILIVEGSLNVPEGVMFKWDGLVIVKPPSSEINPQINLSGNVTINGGLVALHEAMPNSGHMDVTAFRDMYGNWSKAWGAEGSWSMQHTHDFTGKYGNSITFYSSVSSERKHEGALKFKQTLDKLNGSDQIFLELWNTNAHGRGSLSIEKDGLSRVANPVAAGFHDDVANPANVYRTNTMSVNDLKYLHIDILRLSSLKKMWDTNNRYDNCISNSGPLCVGYARDRYGALTLSMYKVSRSLVVIKLIRSSSIKCQNPTYSDPIQCVVPSLVVSRHFIITIPSSVFRPGLGKINSDIKIDQFLVSVMNISNKLI